ncbi:MAG: hypothetical protein ACRBN8_34185 [Nannocystales bacterium]
MAAKFDLADIAPRATAAIHRITTRLPRHGIRPTVAGKNKWARVEALEPNAAFPEDHELVR